MVCNQQKNFLQQLVFVLDPIEALWSDLGLEIFLLDSIWCDQLSFSWAQASGVARVLSLSGVGAASVSHGDS